MYKHNLSYLHILSHIYHDKNTNTYTNTHSFPKAYMYGLIIVDE